VQFRAWSAGCSSGEEPYTLAIILAELGLETRSAIVASDISAAALGRARAGEYSSWSLRGGSDPRAARWLHEDRGLLRVDPRLRSAITFLELNLAAADLPDPAKGLSDLDLILCRNVLLYLTPDVVGRVASRLFECLAPGGFLLTSPSDPSLSRHAPFTIASGAFGIAYERPRTARERPLSAPRTAPRVAQTVARPDPLRAREQAVSRAKAEAPRPPRPSPAGLRAAPSTAARLAVPPLPDACPGCRALVDAGRLPEALELVTAAVRENPLAPELHLLEAIIMADLGRLAEAEAACRKGLYLDRSDPFLHFFLGTVLLRRRSVNAAAAALRAAARLAEGRDPDEQVAWSEGMTARELAAAARWQLERLQGGVPAGAGT
jgi:chemotaxis protein methyltransferase CheR